MIPHNRPTVPPASINKLNKILATKHLSTGKSVRIVEKIFTKKFQNIGNSILVSSGTSALFLSILHMKNDKKKTRILVPTYACSALLNAILLANCIPVVADIEYESLTLETKKKFKNIDIIIAVNIFGSRPNLKRIKKLYPSSKIILDSCHSIGMKFNRELLIADSIIFSFYATKIITCGHGGLIWSKNKKFINKIFDYINFDQKKNYKQRFNFLLSDIQASLLIEQVNNLEKIRLKRNKIFKLYLQNESKEILFFKPYDLKEDVVYRSVVLFRNSKKRNDFKKLLKKNKVETIIPIEKFELLHRYLNLDNNNYEISEDISSRSLSLPMHLSLKKNQIHKICKLIKNFR